MPISWVRTECSGEKIPTASVPQIPQLRWTEMAPTGSSTLMRSKKTTENTTITPATSPIVMADHIAIRSAPAVIPTSPASTPFSPMERSGFPETNSDANIAASPPAAAARQVVTRVRDTSSGSAESTEPPLNPNHPSHSRNTPTAASGSELPGIGVSLPRTYLPTRGPSIQANVFLNRMFTVFLARVRPMEADPVSRHPNRRGPTEQPACQSSDPGCCAQHLSLHSF